MTPVEKKRKLYRDQVHVSCVLQFRCMQAYDTMASQPCIALKDAKNALHLLYSHRLCSSMHNSLMSGLVLLCDADPTYISCLIVQDFWGEIQAPT